jgi:trans-aconitate methyltransferase
MSHMSAKKMTPSERQQHWEEVYRSKPAVETSWYQAEPTTSLDMIHNTGALADHGLIDVGGGASLLVDHLLQLGCRDLTVLDLSAEAMEQARQRLAAGARRVQWVVSDITEYVPDRHFGVWHDRAAFHFLTDPADRERYVQVLRSALWPGGQAIIAAFAPDGPERCSGLEIVRYDADAMGATLGNAFSLLEERRETHLTPLGREQRFGFYRFRYRAGD